MFDTTTFVAPRQAAAARLQAPEPEPAGSVAADFRRDSQFVQMLRGYGGSGGMARRSEVLGLAGPALPGR